MLGTQPDKSRAALALRRILLICFGICALGLVAFWAFCRVPYYDPAVNCFLVSGYSKINDSLVAQLILTNPYPQTIRYQDPTGAAGPGVKVSVRSQAGVTNYRCGDVSNAGWFNLRSGATKNFSVPLPEDTVSWRISTLFLAPSARMRFRIICTDAGLYRRFKYDTLEAFASCVPDRTDPGWEVQSDEVAVP